MGSTGSQWDEESVDQMMMMMMLMMIMMIMIMMIMIIVTMIMIIIAIRLDYLKERVSQKNKRYYLRVVRRT